MPEDLPKKISENDDEEVIEIKDDNEAGKKKINSDKNTMNVDDSQKPAKADTFGIP
jgi:tryptophanyl-tRNA synthetase